jgi:rhamnosyltransferase
MKIVALIPIYSPQASFKTKVVPLLQKQTLSPSLLLINSGKEAFFMPNAKITTIPQREFNHANTRNLALNYEADFYLFMTQDAMPHDEFLIENVTKAFEDPDVMVAYARQIPYVDANATEVFARTVNYPPFSKIKSKDDLPSMGIKTFFCSDSCAMYRASYFHAMGGFKKDLCTNEDMEFATRVIMDGKKVAYVAEAKVYHSHTFTCKDIWRRYRAIGGFFRDNRWILEVVSTFTKVESTGVKYALAELGYLFKHSPLDIPRSIACSLIKYIALKSKD